MADTLAEIDGAQVADEQQFRREVVDYCRPVVLRGLVADWPAVAAARRSPAAFRDYVAALDRGGTMDAFIGDAAIRGRYYYSEDLAGFNFERRRMSFAAALDLIVANLDLPEAETVYVGSLPTRDYLPGFTEQNALALLPPTIGPRIWLGHASTVSTHYDTLDNVACVVAGRRRFTLYPPELIGDLYVGPIDNTMAGQPVSLAASARDDARYPRFAAVRDRALTAELEPGDAIYMPKLWWHQIEALAPFNGLVNYWWDAFGAGPDQPYAAMLLAMITIAERPVRERAAWRAFFDHYVFRQDGHPLAHLPVERHGLLGPLKDNYGKIRARIMHMLRG
jgi:hypothetical protein